MNSVFQQVADRGPLPVVQFVKYSLCGGLATAVDFFLFFILSIFVLQAVAPDDTFVVLWGQIYDVCVERFPGLVEIEWLKPLFHFDVDPLDDTRRTIRAAINKTIAFVFSNFTAYITNILWVFESGRHSRRMELGLFYAVSGTSYVVGTGAYGHLDQGFWTRDVGHVHRTSDYVCHHKLCLPKISYL